MIKTWLIAFRLKTLLAAISPVLLGLALAFHEDKFYIWVAIATLLAAILLQIGSNLANDVYDFLKGSDTEKRLGPQRVTQSGLLTPTQVKKGMVFIFALAVTIGFYLAYIGGWAIVVIGIASIIAGIIYTGGPYPLGYHGWGDIFVFVFFGLIAVPGTYYLQTSSVTLESIILGIAMGAISTAILIVNNLRDIETDSESSKRTLAVRFGKQFVKTEYHLMMIIAYIVPAILMMYFDFDRKLVLPYFSLPLAIQLSIKIQNTEGKALNKVLTQTAKLLFIYSLLFAFGIAR
jgi:1,4-dihydroxy-2-naphthoate polyprenyltransferase